MATVYKQLQQSTAVSLLTAELNAIGSGTVVVSSSSFNNIVGTANLDGYPLGCFVLSLAAPAATFTAGAVNVWFLRSIDGGTTFESYPSGSPPARLPDLTFYPDPTISAQTKPVTAPLPVGYFKVLLQPANMTSAFAASGNTLKVLAQTTEQV